MECRVGLLAGWHAGDLPQVRRRPLDNVIDDGLVEGQVVLVHVAVAVVHVHEHQQYHGQVFEHRPRVDDDAHHSERD